MDTSLSHVALLVSSADASANFLKGHGIRTEEPEIFETEGTKEVYVGSYDSQSGLLLLLEPISEGPYKRALEKRGPSLHHIALDVLNVEEFIFYAQKIGWKLHTISAQTLLYKTAWLFKKGVPTLIEVNQRKELSVKPFKVSSLELPFEKEHFKLFDGIGLGKTVKQSKELSLSVNGHKFSFAQIFCIE